MDHILIRHKDQLILRTDFFDDPTAHKAYAALMRDVFTLELEPSVAAVGRDPVWKPFALFDREGRCAAGIEAGVLTVMADAALLPITAIRLAGVDPAWRGLGLFRDLMSAALAWCEAAASGPTLLYTADHALYERFGFQPVAQFKTSGQAPPLVARQPSRVIDPHDSEDTALLRRILATRAPVSTRCALVGAASLFLSNVLGAEDLVLAYAADLDAIIVYEIDDTSILLVDIVAAAIPTMAQILSVLPLRPRAEALFPTDRLDWTGGLVREETGLMLRGRAPAAMAGPFMLPPTMEF